MKGPTEDPQPTVRTLTARCTRCGGPVQTFDHGSRGRYTCKPCMDAIYTEWFDSCKEWESAQR